LTELGKQQIGRLALLLADDGVVPSVIFSSPILRAQQTTQGLLHVFPAVPVIFDDRLMEVDTAQVTGTKISDVDAAGDIYTGAVFADKGVERPAQIIERMMEVMKVILQKYCGKTVFVVSHGDPLSFLYWRLLHPLDNDIPAIKFLEKTDYLLKGEAWKVVIDGGDVVSSKHIYTKV
jgi:broad specificity phosphatase PhoE